LADVIFGGVTSLERFEYLPQAVIIRNNEWKILQAYWLIGSMGFPTTSQGGESPKAGPVVQQRFANSTKSKIGPILMSSVEEFNEEK
jgi:hypothetical protein